MNAISRTFGAAMLVLTVLWPATTLAQTRPENRDRGAVVDETSADRASVGDLRRSLDRIVRDSGAVADRQTQAPTHSSAPVRERSVARKIIGGAVGAVGGFFGGGFLGAAIDGECDCDDPGLKGFVIGAPIGAVIGGIVGAKWF